MTTFVTAGDLCCLVLHPHTAVDVEAQCVAECVGSPERGDVKASACHRGDVGIHLLDQRDARRLGHAVCCSKSIPREVGTKRDERVGVVGSSQGREAVNQSSA